MQHSNVEHWCFVQIPVVSYKKGLASSPSQLWPGGRRGPDVDPIHESALLSVTVGETLLKSFHPDLHVLDGRSGDPVPNIVLCGGSGGRQRVP